MPETYPPHAANVTTPNGTVITVICACLIGHDHDYEEMGDE